MQVTNYINSDNDFSTVAHNGSRLCEVADFQHKFSFEELNLNLALNCHRNTKPAILQNRCWCLPLLSFQYSRHFFAMFFYFIIVVRAVCVPLFVFHHNALFYAVNCWASCIIIFLCCRHKVTQS